MTSVIALATAALICPAWVDNADGGIRLAYRFSTGQELVYSGSIIETCCAVKGVKYEQPYDLEVTILLSSLDASGNAEADCFTMVRMPNHEAAADRQSMEDAATYHFDSLKLEPRGLAVWRTGERKNKTAPPMAEGQAPWETGFCLEMPADPVKLGSQWTIQREGQLPIQCKISAAEMVDGEYCWKIDCTQTSPTWSQATIGVPTWKSESQLWMSPKKGTTIRVIRNYMVRQPGDVEPTRIIRTNYTLATNLVFAGPQLMERSADFSAACQAQEEWEKYVAGKSPRTPKNHLADIQHQLKFALSKPNASPYRFAMTEMMNVAGECEKTAPAVRRPNNQTPTAPYLAASLGRKARHFSIRTADPAGETMSLKSFKGKAVVLVYCHPESPLSIRALEAVVRSMKMSRTPPTVYAVCPKTDKETMDALRRQVFGSYQICKAQAIDRSYGMTAYPHTIMVDEEGILRANFAGFGPELAVSISDEMNVMMRRQQQLSGKEAAPAFQR